MFDFHPDNTKKFKLEHTKEFDKNFKDINTQNDQTDF